MIFRSTDDDGQAIEPVQDAAQVTVHITAQLLVGEKRSAIASGEDRMNDDFAE